MRGFEKKPKGRRSKARVVPMSPLLEETLRALAETRRGREGPWSDPGHVFLSPVGKRIDERNFNRVWDRVRRQAAELGVRPLRLHDLHRDGYEYLRRDVANLEHHFARYGLSCGNFAAHAWGRYQRGQLGR